jgi:hypothetical protein
MYKLINTQCGYGVKRFFDNASIPFSLDNTDYQQFKKDLANGSSLQDVDGNEMVADAIKTFLEGLA